MTKICVFGAGAIGGYVGARLALKGEAEVSLVARGAHLAAMWAGGLTLKQGGETHVVRPAVTDRPAELGHQDFIILTLKAHGLAGVIDQMMPLIGPDTTILFAQNGIPWWYFHGIGGPLEGTRIESVDPGGVIWDRIGPERALGSSAATFCAPLPASAGRPAQVVRPRHRLGGRDKSQGSASGGGRLGGAAAPMTLLRWAEGSDIGPGRLHRGFPLAFRGLA